MIYSYILILGYRQHVEGVLARADLLVSVSLESFLIVVWVSLVRSFLGGVYPPHRGKVMSNKYNYIYFCIIYVRLILPYVIVNTYLSISGYMYFTTHATQECMGWAWSNIATAWP